MSAVNTLAYCRKLKMTATKIFMTSGSEKRTFCVKICYRTKLSPFQWECRDILLNDILPSGIRQNNDKQSSIETEKNQCSDFKLVGIFMNAAF